MAEFKVGDQVKWTYEGYSGTGVIIKHGSSDRYQWHVKRDVTGWPLNDVLMLRTSDLALIDSVITEYHGFHVGDVVAVRGSGFTGKIAEFSNANRPGGITVVIMNERGERRGITTTDIEKALIHKPAEKPRLQVGDKVKVVSGGNFVGMTGTIVKDDKSDVPFLVELPNGRERWFIERNLVKIDDVKPVENKIKVGDTVKVVRDRSFRYGRTGVVVAKDESSVPFLVKFEDNIEYWYSPDSIRKVEEEKPQENKIKIDDRVKVVGMNVEDDRQFVGRTGVCSEINTTMRYHIGVQIDGYGFRRFSEKCLEVVAEKPQEKRKFKVGDKVKIKCSWARVNVGTISMDDGTNRIPYRVVDGNGEFILWCDLDNLEKIEDEETQKEPKFNVGDKVKIISDRACHTGEIGIIVEDDRSDRKPLKVERENGTHLWWCEPEWLEKVEDAKPVDDWRARFEAFKASHPVGTKVKIAKKVEDDEHAELWVASMDKTVGRIGVIQSYDHNDNTYDINISSSDTEFSWNYPIDALEDVAETNQYTFTVKPSDVDLKRIWRESNPDFAVVVDMNKDSNTVFILHKGWGINDFVIDWGVRKDKVEERINQLRDAYENEKKQRIVVTIY